MNMIPSKHHFDIISIHADDALSSASFVPARGGAGCSITLPWQNQAREILFLHDSFWDEEIDDLPGGWPYCFPNCGRLSRDGVIGRYAFNNHHYTMPIHGVAWWQTWTVESTNTRQLTLSLLSNEISRKHYPFDFRVTLEYEIHPGKLHCRQSVINLGAVPLPYYAGFHPYFLLQDAADKKSETQIHFNPGRRLQYNAELTDIQGEADGLTFPASLSNPEINEQLFEITDSPHYKITFPDGFVLRMRASDDFRYCQLYTMPEKPFFCVEPWMGHPNQLNHTQDVRWLPPGETDKAWVEVSCD